MGGDVTPEEIAEFRTWWVGREFWNAGMPDCELPVWTGDEVVDEGDSVILKFHAEDSAELLGVRFSNEPLPVRALMWDEDVDTSSDWFLDRRIALGVALDTGLLLRAIRRPHPGWTELVVDPKAEYWEWEPPPPRRSPFAAIRERIQNRRTPE